MTARRQTPLALAGLIAAALAAPALAQTATITMSHDEPDGVIEPGETIRVKMRIAWSAPNIQLAGFAGQIRHDPLAGSAVGAVSSRFSAFSSGTLVDNGTVVGDDIVGIDVASVPSFFTPMVPPPFGHWQGFDAYSHDWTAPTTPGTYHISFVPTALRPHVMVYPNVQSPMPGQAITTYIPATITVIPAPMTLLPLIAATTLARRRRP